LSGNEVGSREYLAAVGTDEETDILKLATRTRFFVRNYFRMPDGVADFAPQRESKQRIP
jgi:hypothetical protein